MKTAGTKPKDAAPRVYGTGLIALDLVISADPAVPPRFHAGGTCGNVLAILSYLGWSAYPIARLGDDVAAGRVRRDLRRWNVSLTFADLEPPADTPVIVERITRNGAGQPVHRFSFTCPACGAWFPGYRPVHATSAAQVSTAVTEPKVFLFDRVSRASLLLAKRCADQGAMVVFEPSGVGDAGLFREAMGLSHVVKYSADRLRDLTEIHGTDGPLLAIETLGAEGLRYRSLIPGHQRRQWQRLTGYDVEHVADTAGAGDWLTAGLVYRLGGRGREGLESTTPLELLNAFKFSQAAAAWNCQFEGPRGGMYVTDRESFLAAVSRIGGDGERRLPSPEETDRRVRRAARKLCSPCSCQAGSRVQGLKGRGPTRSRTRAPAA